MIKKKIVK